MNIIDYITKNKKVTQKQIAALLDVSQTQVSKWKAGEYISTDKEEKLKKLAGLFCDDTDFAILVKTKKNAKAWFKYIREIATNDDVLQIEDFDEEFFIQNILTTLNKFNVKIPETPPSLDEEDDPFSELLYEMIKNYSYLTTWWDKYTEIDYDSSELNGMICGIRLYATEISILHIDEELRHEAGIMDSFYNEINGNIRLEAMQKINEMCKLMISLRLPIMADYFRFVNAEPYEFYDECEFDGLFFSIEDKIPLSENKILRQTEITKKILLELHKKIDKMLSPKAKEELTKELTYTKPDSNYLKEFDFM